MAILKKPAAAAAEEGEGNIFWVTMADLLLGLAIIFMTLFVLAMTGFTQQKISQKQNQIKASQEISEKLKEASINAEVDKVSGDIKISDLELFDVGSYTLSQKGKLFLDKLVPIYINNIFSREELLEGVDGLVVQGHTDSQSFAGLSSKEEQFVRNMDLSLRRANSVAEYMFKTNYDKKYTNELIKMVTVEGKSFTDPVLVNGKEDYNQSRRVELRLKVKSFDIAGVLFSTGKN